MNRHMLLALVLVMGGCTFGPRVDHEPLAREPRGANVTLQARNASVAGELLAVQDTALLVLTTEQRMVLVPYRGLRRGDAEMRIPIVRGGEPPSEAQRTRLRRVSRYPQGVDSALQRALLDAYGQPEIEVFRP